MWALVSGYEFSLQFCLLRFQFHFSLLHGVLAEPNLFGNADRRSTSLLCPGGAFAKFVVAVAPIFLLGSLQLCLVVAAANAVGSGNVIRAA